MPDQLTTAERWLIVDRHHLLGRSIRTTARELRCSPATVKRIVRLDKETGDVHRRPGSGRPARLDSDARNALDTALSSTPRATNPELTDYLHRHGAPSFHTTTLERTRKQLGWYRIKDRVRLELSAADRRRRLEFVAANRERNWKLVVWSDEKQFSITASDYVWVKSGMNKPERVVRTVHGKVMVWGAVWFTGRSSLAFTTGKINSVKYHSILATHLLPSAPLSAGFVFQQDNAPAHTSAATRAWWSQYAVPLLTPWPAHSPRHESNRERVGMDAT